MWEQLTAHGANAPDDERSGRALVASPARRPLEDDMVWNNLMNVMALMVFGGVALIAIVAVLDGIVSFAKSRHE